METKTSETKGRIVGLPDIEEGNPNEPEGDNADGVDESEDDDADGVDESGDDSAFSLKVVGNIVPITGKEPYAELRANVIRFRQQIDVSKWSLARCLYEVAGSGSNKPDDRIYPRWGYDSWDSYLASEASMKQRRADYLTRFYKTFAIEFVKGMTPKSRESFLEKIQKTEFSKMIFLERLIRKGLVTTKNIKEWLKKATRMTCLEFEEEVKKLLKANVADSGEEKDIEEGLSTMSIKFYPEQKAIVLNALEMAEKILESENRGHQMSMICQDFLSTNMAQTPKGSKERDGYFNKIGAIFGVHLVAIDRETNRIVYGNRDDFKAALTE